MSATMVAGARAAVKADSPVAACRTSVILTA